MVFVEIKTRRLRKTHFVPGNIIGYEVVNPPIEPVFGLPPSQEKS